MRSPVLHFLSSGKTRCPTLVSVCMWPPVSSRVLYQKQRARGERKPQSANLFIETNSEQKGKYLVSSAVNGQQCWGSPQLKSGGNSRLFVCGQNGALRGVTAGGPTSQTQGHTNDCLHIHSHRHTQTHMHKP